MATTTTTASVIYVCQNCQAQNAKMKMCGKCREARYCSPECQRTHWNSQHRGTCKAKEVTASGDNVVKEEAPVPTAVITQEDVPQTSVVV